MTQSKSRVSSAVAVMVVICIALAASIYVEASNQIHSPRLFRVACVGDSITQITSYPSDLQTMLGPSSMLGNFGVSGSTVDLASPKPYMYQKALQGAVQFQPTTVIIMLGTNDARADVYPSIDKFESDYKMLIQQFEDLRSKPKILLVIPPPVFNNTLNISNENLDTGVIPRIEQVANQTGLPIIDANTPLLQHADDFVDGVHPNNDGAQVIANTIYQGITENEES